MTKILYNNNNNNTIKKSEVKKNNKKCVRTIVPLNFVKKTTYKKCTYYSTYNHRFQEILKEFNISFKFNIKTLNKPELFTFIFHRRKSIKQVNQKKESQKIRKSGIYSTKGQDYMVCVYIHTLYI